MRRFKRIKWSVIGYMIAVVFGWLIYRSVAQSRLNEALVEAARKNDLSAVTQLLRQGANPNSYATYTNSVDNPADLWKWIRHDESIFWHEAPLIVDMAGYGGKNDLAIVTALLDAGANVNAHDKRGWTALMDAAGADRPKMVLLLLKHGADKNARTRSGQTAMTEATQYDRKQIVAILKQHR